MTTCPGYGENCYRWPSLINWSLTTIVLRLKGIRYCSIAARGSFKTLAFLNIECKKYKNIETKCVTTSPGLPYSLLKKYTVKNVTNFTICLIFNVVKKLKTGFSKKKSICFTLEIKYITQCQILYMYIEVNIINIVDHNIGILKGQSS